MLAAKVRAEIGVRDAAAIRLGVSRPRLIFGLRLLLPGTLIYLVVIALPIVIGTRFSLPRRILGFLVLTLDVGLTLLLSALVLFFLSLLTVLRRLFRVLAVLILTLLILPIEVLLIRWTSLILPVLGRSGLIPVFILRGRQ